MSRAKETTAQSPLFIHNCGSLASGDVNRPLLDGDAILITEGVIAGVGWKDDFDLPDQATVIDANGLDVLPGLYDAHLHPGFGDWSDRLQVSGWMRAYVNAGVTSGISQGSFLVPGFPTDRVGAVNFAVALAHCYRDYRPGGMKLHAGAVSLVEGINEDDLRTLRDEGVWLISELGVRSIGDVQKIHTLLSVAHGLGFKSRAHFGPKALPEALTVTAEMVSAMGVQIACHVNGGPTAPADSEIAGLIEETDAWIELCATGNTKVALDTASALAPTSLDRLLLGSDTPTGAGMIPRAMWRMIATLSASLGIPPELSIALATGNASRAYDLNAGIIAEGRSADMLLVGAPLDAPVETGLQAVARGDVPSVALIVVDGKILLTNAENTVPPKRSPAIRSATDN